jgi:starch synthase
MPLSLLSVASEIFPLIKTGGLADVAGALPGALVNEGIETLTLVPGYPAVLARLEDAWPVHEYDVLAGQPARLVRGRAAGLNLLVLDAPGFFDRPGNPYLGPDGKDWPDNASRFAALARAAADCAAGKVAGIAPDIVQAHDWQAALSPAYQHYDQPARRVPMVVTIHNLAFQGIFPPHLLGQIGLPAEAFALDGVEYYGRIGYLKGGIQFADHVTTVSPTYADEIRTPADGMGLDGLLRARGDALSGILNGIDTGIWNPAADPLLGRTFSAQSLARRAENKAALQARFGFPPEPKALLLGVVSRLSEQKGLDLLLAALPDLERLNMQLVLLGSGDPRLEAGFARAAARAPERIGCVLGYDEALAHGIQGGADALLVPSRFEPCGLTQLCALRYGAVPVVARVGGLNDTVVDASPAALQLGAATGIQFAANSLPALQSALARAARLWADRATWARLQANGMRTDVSWAVPAATYRALFRALAVS